MGRQAITRVGFVTFFPGFVSGDGGHAVRGYNRQSRTGSGG
jgi:hypothetical protein